MYRGWRLRPCVRRRCWRMFPAPPGSLRLYCDDECEALDRLERLEDAAAAAVAR